MSKKSPAARARYRERKAAEYAEQMALIPAHAKCGNCKHFGRVPVSDKRCCDVDSDFYGYAIVTADHQPCPYWKQRA